MLFSRVRRSHGKPGKSWNQFVISFTRQSKLCFIENHVHSKERKQAFIERRKRMKIYAQLKKQKQKQKRKGTKKQIFTL